MIIDLLRSDVLHSWGVSPESTVEIAAERLLDQCVKAGGGQFGCLLQPLRTLKSLEGSSRVVAKEPVDSTRIVPEKCQSKLGNSDLYVGCRAASSAVGSRAIRAPKREGSFEETVGV